MSAAPAAYNSDRRGTPAIQKNVHDCSEEWSERNEQLLGGRRRQRMGVREKDSGALTGGLELTADTTEARLAS